MLGDDVVIDLNDVGEEGQSLDLSRDEVDKDFLVESLMNNGKRSNTCVGDGNLKGRPPSQRTHPIRTAHH